MTFHELLDIFINISDIPKNTLAVTLNISPSALSKYLSGSRLPPAYLIRDFIDITAELLAPAIMTEERLRLLDDHFVFLYKFENVDELREFIEDALSYYYDLSDSDDGTGFLAGNTVRVGIMKILNFLCLHCSRWADGKTDLTRENLYSSVWMHRILGGVIASRLKLNSKAKGAPAFHFSIHPENIGRRKSLVKLASEFEQYLSFFNLFFWTSEGRPEEQFFYLPDHSLILFEFVHYEEPIMLLVTDKAYLKRIEPSLMRYFTRSLTHTRDSMEQFIRKKGPALIRLCEDEGVFAFSFFPYSMLFSEETRQKLIPDPNAAALYQAVFDHVVCNPSRAVLSLNALREFLRTGVMCLPFYKDLEVDQSFIFEYLTLYVRRLCGEGHSTLRLYRNNLKYTFLFCLKDRAVFFFRANEHNEDKFLIIPIPQEHLSYMLLQDTFEEHFVTISLNADNWELYTHTLDLLLSEREDD